MVSLKTVNKKFLLNFQVVDRGSGFFSGTLSEAEQSSQPAFMFIQPRHVLRTRYPTGLTPGMMIKSPSGELFMVGENGPSENRHGTLWQSFRMFEPTGEYSWTRRVKTLDPVTRVEVDGEPKDLGPIWAAIEPFEREQMDRDMRHSFEQSRFIAGHPVEAGDFIHNRQVTKVDKQLGLYVGVLTN